MQTMGIYTHPIAIVKYALEAVPSDPRLLDLAVTESCENSILGVKVKSETQFSSIVLFYTDSRSAMSPQGCGLVEGERSTPHRPANSAGYFGMRNEMVYSFSSSVAVVVQSSDIQSIL